MDHVSLLMSTLAALKSIADACETQGIGIKAEHDTLQIQAARFEKSQAERIVQVPSVNQATQTEECETVNHEAVDRENSLLSQVDKYKTRVAELEMEVQALKALKGVSFEISAQATREEYQPEPEVIEVEAPAVGLRARIRSHGESSRPRARHEYLASYSLVPQKRQELLELLPRITKELPERSGLGESFSRAQVQVVLGGSFQRCMNPGYYAFRLRSNPWLPQQRLRHGYAFIGLPGPGTSIIEESIGSAGPEIQHLFVELSLGKSRKEQGRWHYFGQYECSHVPSSAHPTTISPAEWKGLDQTFRERYTEVAKSRYGRDQLTARSLGEAYANGDKNCPVRLLKCIGYDTALYERLCQAKVAMTRGAASSSTAGRKRNRDEDDEDENDEYDDDAPGPSKRRSLRGNLLILEALRTLARDGL